jgi:AbrB family looped-hinge helix DNA binding protein
LGGIASKVTAKGQITTPAEVRAKLGLKPGDAVVYRQAKSGVVIRKAGILDAEFLKLLQRAQRLALA